MSEEFAHESTWHVGDIVSRDGTDEHKILEINDAGDLIHVECVKVPSRPWTEVGETEWNCGSRYHFVRRTAK